ncbi:MAG: flagellar assembly protein FliW [Desulfovibrionaceae bacterium]
MAKQQEKVIQTRLGKQSITMDKVIYFPRGLIGLENLYEFTLLQIREGAPFLMLQSLDKPSVGLLVADPYSFTADYEIKVGEAEMRLLRLKNIREVAVLVTVSIPQGKPEKTALNLTGPILVNYNARIGLQVPQIDTKYSKNFYLHEQKK